MALPELVTLEIRQGDTWTRVLTLLEDDGTTPIDLTGASVEFSIAKARRKSPSWTWRSDDDTGRVTVTDPEGGEIRLLQYPDDSRAFNKLEELEFEVTVEFGVVRQTVLEGSLLVRLEVAHEEEGVVAP